LDTPDGRTLTRRAQRPATSPWSGRGDEKSEPLDAELDAALTAITPIDGRYRGRTAALRGYFSELALIRYRVRI